MTTTASTLTAFLLNRIAEDEATIRRVSDTQPVFADLLAESLGDVASPQRMLADCDAKRRIIHACSATTGQDVNEFAEWDVLRLLALPYANHPDYQPDWHPDTTLGDVGQAGPTLDLGD
jgi:hypothetical protein